MNYLITSSKTFSVGLDRSAPGDAAFLQPIPGGVHVFGLIRGSTLPDQYVIVGGHYDHFAPGRCQEEVTGDDICDGTTDNAAGVSAAMSVGREITRRLVRPRRSVIIALWDREEDGLLGSAYYMEHPIVPPAQTVGYVNFDIQGANLLSSLRNITFAVGAQTGGSALDTIVRDSGPARVRYAAVELDLRAGP